MKRCMGGRTLAMVASARKACSPAWCGYMECDRDLTWNVTVIVIGSCMIERIAEDS